MCANILNPMINSETVNSATIKSLAVSSITFVSSSTVKNETVTNLTVTNINGSAYTAAATVINGTWTPAPNSQGTVTNAVGFYQQIGNMVHAWGTFKSGTETGGIASMPIPIGSIVYTNRAAADGSTFCGWIHLMFGSRSIASGNLAIIFLDGSDTANVYFGPAAPATGAAAWPKTLGTGFNNNTYFSFDFWYAVS